jgi:hypothetical protein
MEQYLVHSIHSSLSLGLHENARFLAERLVAADPSEVCAQGQRTACRVSPVHATVPLTPLCAGMHLQDHKFLLATCYRHCHQGYRAVQLLKGEPEQTCHGCLSKH